MTIKKTHIVLLILLAVAIGIIISTVSDVSTYATFSETAAYQGKEFHVIGTLNKEKPVEVQLTDNGSMCTFYMFDKENAENKVVFFGEKPQDFEKSEQVVIVGQMNNNIFTASGILLKCPSKYDKEGYNTEEEFKSNSQ